MDSQNIQKTKHNSNNTDTLKNHKTNSTKKQREKRMKKEKESKNKKANAKQSKMIQKNKKPLSTWKKLEFPISQLSGKIQKNYKNLKIPKFLDKEDIDIILTLISKESKNFSPVKANTKLTFIFIFLILSSFAFGILFLIQKKVGIGVILIILCFILCFIYIHIIRKSINNKYKKCHQDLFYLTDYINRKYLGDLGYYLLIDYNFKFIGIYTIPNYIQEILKYRDHNIELKKTLEGDTINHLHKKPNYKLDKSNNYINNTFYNNYYNNIFNTNLNAYTLGYNYKNIYNTYNINLNNNNGNFNNDITYDEGCTDDKNNIIKDKVKFNNFFKSNNNDINDEKIKSDNNIIDIPINRRNVRANYKNNIREIINEIDKLNKKEDKIINNKNGKDNYYGNKNEEMNSQVNNKSIDKFKDYIENKYNGLGMLNKYAI